MERKKVRKRERKKKRTEQQNEQFPIRFCTGIEIVSAIKTQTNRAKTLTPFIYLFIYLEFIRLVCDLLLHFRSIYQFE